MYISHNVVVYVWFRVVNAITLFHDHKYSRFFCKAAGIFFNLFIFTVNSSDRNNHGPLITFFSYDNYRLAFNSSS